MNDRTALNSFLKDAGFSTAGDLVLLEPAHSETREVRSSEKAVVATISTRARDRQGDIIEPAGVRLERFRKNPVVLYAHDYEALPVARSMWERVRQANGATAKTPRSPRGTAHGQGEDALGALVVRGGVDVELVAKPQFHLDTELSREVWALVEKGVLSAWSVGFIPERWERVEGEDAGGRDGGGAARPSSFRILKWDLLEYSCVPVPANFQALTHELKERRITAPALVKSLAPLGFEAPDLVAAPIQGPTTKTPRSPRGTSDGKTEETPGGLGPLVVREVVSRAFDRWLERARGAPAGTDSSAGG